MEGGNDSEISNGETVGSMPVAKISGQACQWQQSSF